MTHYCVTSSTSGVIKKMVCSLDPSEFFSLVGFWEIADSISGLGRGHLPIFVDFPGFSNCSSFIFRTILKFQGILFFPVLWNMVFINPLFSWKWHICFSRNTGFTRSLCVHHIIPSTLFLLHYWGGKVTSWVFSRQGDFLTGG